MYHHIMSVFKGPSDMNSKVIEVNSQRKGAIY